MALGRPLALPLLLPLLLLRRRRRHGTRGLENALRPRHRLHCHALQAVVGGVDGDAVNGAARRQKGAQHREDVDGAHVLPVEV